MTYLRGACVLLIALLCAGCVTDLDRREMQVHQAYSNGQISLAERESMLSAIGHERAARSAAAMQTYYQTQKAFEPPPTYQVYDQYGRPVGTMRRQ